MLLLHGLGSLSSNWENEWKSELAKRARVIVPQYPVPFPRDLRVVARSIVDGLDNGPSTLSIVGHSMGGMIAIEVLKEALERGKAVNCVVLVATTGKGNQHPVITEAVSILDKDARSNPTFSNPKRTLQQLVAFSKSYPEFSSLTQSQSVQAFLNKDPQSMQLGLEQLRAALVWMSSTPTTPTTPTTPQQSPRIVVVVAGLDDVLPPSQNLESVYNTLWPMQITDVIMLDDTPHHAEQVFTGSDAAEFILGCGSMSVLSRFRMALRFLALRFSRSILIAAVVAVVVILLLQKKGGTKFKPPPPG